MHSTIKPGELCWISRAMLPARDIYAPAQDAMDDRGSAKHLWETTGV
jgi:hypothetical protein